MTTEQPDNRSIKRNIMPRLRQFLGAFRVVILHGPRQVGKSTLLRQLHTEFGGTLLNLDDPALLAAALRDPVGFISDQPLPMFIDEVQRGGEALVVAIKLAVDADPRPGRFVLTGSANFLTVPLLSESLAGRAWLGELWPMSQGELQGTVDLFFDRVFEPDARWRPADVPAEGRLELFARLCRGGFPEPALGMQPPVRAAWHESYLRTILRRDAMEIAAVRRIDALQRLVELIAARSASVLNATSLARDAGLPPATSHAYLSLLETLGLVRRIPSWSRNLTAKVKRHPKVMLCDSGLAATLIGAEPEGLVVPGNRVVGPLLESFVTGELLRQSGWAATRARIYHFRDRDGAEVDLILEAGDGRVVAVEVKAALSVADRDFRWLRLLRRKLGQQFCRGVVLYAGSAPLQFGDRFVALPVSALWQSHPVDRIRPHGRHSAP